MTIDLVLTFLKDPEREYDAAEVAEGTGLAEKAILSHLRSLWKGGMLERRKDNDRGRLVYRTKQAQLQLNMANGSSISFVDYGGEPLQGSPHSLLAMPDD